jgi:hypothetical protein
MHEDGIGMARTFEASSSACVDGATGPRAASSPGSTAPRRGATARRAPTPGQVTCAPAARAPSASSPALRRPGARAARRVPRARRRAARPVANEFFGGNIGVTGLMVGADLARTLAAEPRAPLPPARRLPQRWGLPRRLVARGPPPAGRGRADRRRALRRALARARRPPGGRRRERPRPEPHMGEIGVVDVHAGLPTVAVVGRPNVGKSTPSTASSGAARPSSRSAPASPGTARSCGPSGSACRSRWSTPAGGCCAARRSTTR